MVRSRNPIGFTPLPVSFFTTVIYIALFSALLVVHHVLPAAPNEDVPKGWDGVNITEAWLDLKELSTQYHPYNSRANLDVRAWLLARVQAILDANGVDWRIEKETSIPNQQANAGVRAVTLFDDKRSNITFANGPFGGGYSSYFEGDNIMVYIRGTEDDQKDWWTIGREHDGPGGVLVNAHYDSVSTGFGATDDGMGVISVLQLISHFSKERNLPKKGILALLNNGEEDGLYGANAFTEHPMSNFPHSFLNLEGAGAGGRATLFRSTDTEVTKFYARSKYPFGSVISADGFKRGFIRSGTDYSVFTESLGMRGLDVAFMAPRARYHTSEDDARDASIDSLWHMLSAALETVKGLSDDTSSTFESSDDDAEDGHRTGQGSNGVWFDVLGRTFATIELHDLFALSITLLVAAPVLLVLLEIIIRKSHKWYPFARKRYLHSSDDDQPVQFYGMRGFFRFPLTFIVSTVAVLALAYLLTKVNPYILYSSEYAVWIMMLTAWVSVSWFLLRLADSIRPSALSRLFVLIWLHALSWLALVAAAVGENNFKLGGGYFILIYNAAIFVALLISYCELFALPKKGVYVEHAYYGPDHDGHPAGAEVDAASVRSRPTSRGPESNANENDDSNERTSLLNNRQTFTRSGYGGAGRGRRDSVDTADHPTGSVARDPLMDRAYEGEQAWSSSLPSWTWLLQFLILSVVPIVLVGQISLLLTSAVNQTPADGNAVLSIYIIIAGLAVLLALPLAPFMHRLKWQIPTFLFLVFLGCLIYNIMAFPFSRDARLKVYFVQSVDAINGSNQVALVGVDTHIQSIVAELPSAAGQDVECYTSDQAPSWAQRRGLTSCIWAGLTPNVVPSDYLSTLNTVPLAPYANDTKPPSAMRNWVDISTEHVGNTTKQKTVDINIRGLNTRACRLFFSTPVQNITINGNKPYALTDEEFRDPKKSDSMKQFRLWSREWDAKFLIRAIFPKSQSDSTSDDKAVLEGRVSCQYADANVEGTIPALDEVRKFAPVWSIVSKHADGLVEVYKDFSV